MENKEVIAYFKTCYSDGCEQHNMAINIAITALERADKKPQILTLTELKNMDGKPVWVESITGWMIVGCGRDNIVRLYDATRGYKIAAEQRCYDREPRNGGGE